MNSANSPERLNAADVAAVLDRFGGHDLLARGSVNIIGLGAIRERAGERWPRKRPDVWAYAERKLAEHLTFQDLSQRVGETDYLIAMTSEEGVAAQAVALKILEEVLMHFLGSADPKDMTVRAVTDLRGDEVTCAPLDPASIIRARKAPPAAETGPRPAVDPLEEKRRNPYVFSTGAGLPLRIDFAVEEIISLKHGAVAALRIEPTVTETQTGRAIPVRTFSKLSDADLSVIDQATIDYASLYLPRVDTPGAPVLIVPVSFRTVAASKGRQALMAAANGAAGRMKASVMVELVDIGPGTPHGRLVEVTGLLKTICRGVFARTQPSREALAALKDARLTGLTLDAGDLAENDAKLAAQILDFGRQARGLTPAVVIQGLTSEIMFSIAETGGLTHAGLRAAAKTVAAA